MASGLPLTVDTGPAPTGRTKRPVLPPAFRLFAGFALLYGIVETTSGNWSTLYMTGTIGASATLASIALTTFWAMVTVGRVLFAAIERRFPETSTYRLLPFVAAVALALAALLPRGDGVAGVLVFGLAGLGCSALLPLTISFGQRDLAAVGAALSGLLIASYQVGLRDRGVRVRAAPGRARGGAVGDLRVRGGGRGGDGVAVLRDRSRATRPREPSRRRHQTRMRRSEC